MIDSGREFLTGLSTKVVAAQLAALTDAEIDRLTDDQLRARLVTWADQLDDTAFVVDFLDDFVTAARLSATDAQGAVQYLLPRAALDHGRVHQMVTAGALIVGTLDAQRQARPASDGGLVFGIGPVATLARLLVAASGAQLDADGTRELIAVHCQAPCGHEVLVEVVVELMRLFVALDGGPGHEIQAPREFGPSPPIPTPRTHRRSGRRP